MRGLIRKDLKFKINIKMSVEAYLLNYLLSNSCLNEMKQK